MFFWNKFCGLLAIFFIFIASVNAQNSVSVVSSNHHFISKNKTSASDSVSIVQLQQLSKSINFSTIPGDFSTCNYGFFCRQELKIEKATKLPIRIRLGSLQQCNYYEGKR
jgi:hypothetical protein